MDDLNALFAATRLMLYFGLLGVIFALGAAFVCKLLEWAPVNITIRVIDVANQTDDHADADE